MPKAFETWSEGGVRYLAFPGCHSSQSGAVIVIDENGGNWGGWLTIRDFRRRNRQDRELLGKCALSHVIVKEPTNAKD